MTDRTVTYKIQADATGFRAQMENAAQSTKKLAGDLTATTKQGAELRAGLNQLGSTAGKVGIAAAAGLTGMVKAAMDWETAWTGVLKTVDGTDAQLADLSDGLRDLAKETGFAHAEVAAVAEAAGQLGISTPGIEAFTSTMLDMGVSTNLSAEEAATGFARLRNIMGTTEAEISNTGAAIVGLGNNFATTEAEILAMSMRLAGAGRQSGLTTPEVLGLATAMSSVGIEAEAGGTAMSLTMKRIAKEVETGGDALGLFARVSGLSVDEFTRAWGQDAAGTLTTFVAGLSQAESIGMSTNEVLRELGVTGIRESDSLLRLSGNAEGLAEALRLSGEEWEANSALVEEAGKFYETSAQKMAQSWSSIKDAAIDAGAVMLPVVETVATSVSALAGAFQALPGPVKSSVAPILGVTAAVGGGAWAFTRMVGFVTDTKAALQALGGISPKVAAGMGRMGRAATVAGVAFAGLAIAEAIQDIGKEIPTVEEMTKRLLELADAKAAKDLATEFADLRDAFSDLDNMNWFDKTNNAMSKALGGVGEVHKESRILLEQFDQALENLANKGHADVAADAMRNFAESQDLSAAEQERLLSLLPGYRDALAGIENDATLAADGSSDLAGGFGEVGDAASDAAVEVKSLADIVESFTAVALDQDEAMVAWKRSIQSLSEALTGGSRALDVNTQAGQDNRDAIRSRVEDLLAMQAADEAAGVSAEVMERKMLAGANAILQAGVAAGISEGQMRGYLKQLGLTPRQIKTMIELAGVQAAKDDLNWLERFKLSPKTVSIYVDDGRVRGYKMPGGITTVDADGSVKDFYASGGLRENHVAQIAPAGAWRVWAEPETGGEAYIPLAPSKRDRSLRIWEETGKRLGALSFARGGIASFAYNPGVVSSSPVPDRVVEVLLTAAEKQLEAAEGQVEAAKERVSNRERIASDRRRAADQAVSDVASDLDVMQGQRRVRGLRQSLNAKGKDRLKGLDRQIAQEELREAQAELRRMRNSANRANRLVAQAAVADERLGQAERLLARREQALEALEVERERALEAERVAAERAREEAEAAQFSWQWAADEMAHEAGLLGEALAGLDEQVRDAEAAVDSWAQKMSGVSDSVTSQFVPALFDAYEVVSDIKAPDSVWHAGFVPESDEVATYLDPVQRLRDSISGLEERARLQEQLFARGMSGDAFAAYSAGGNEALSHLLEAGQVREFQALHDQYAALSQSVGSAAGMYAYGGESAAAIAELKGVQAQQQATTKAVEAMQREITIWTARNPNLGEDFAAHLAREAAKGAAAGEAKKVVKL